MFQHAIILFVFGKLFHMTITALFSIAVLIISIVIHEVAHGFAALSQGDLTAKYARRLTLNPISHIDPVGSILVPLMCVLLPGGIVFGWAKPVPINPYNFKNQRFGEFFTAAAGPLSNLVIAVIAGLVLRFWYLALPASTANILVIIVVTNLVLAIFNLMPVPPLDGSKILFSLLPESANQFKHFMDRYGMVLTIFFIFFLWQFVTPLIYIVFTAITGLN